MGCDRVWDVWEHNVCCKVCMCERKREREKFFSCLSPNSWFTVSYHFVSTYQCVLWKRKIYKQNRRLGLFLVFRARNYYRGTFNWNINMLQLWCSHFGLVTVSPKSILFFFPLISRIRAVFLLWRASCLLWPCPPLPVFPAHGHPYVSKAIVLLSV